MILGLFVFVLGAFFGGCAVVINQNIVDMRTEKLMRKNESLKKKIHSDRIVYERYRAYRRGYNEAVRKYSKTKKEVSANERGTEAEKEDHGGDH